MCFARRLALGALGSVQPPCLERVRIARTDPSRHRVITEIRVARDFDLGEAR